MKKRFFQVLDEMVESDIANNTQLVQISNTFVSGNLVKAGAHMTMGVSKECFLEFNDPRNMKVPLLILVDKKEYEKFEKHPYADEYAKKLSSEALEQELDRQRYEKENPQ